MQVLPTVWFNVGDGGYWQRLCNVAMQAMFHPNPVSRHNARQIIKRRAARLLKARKP